VHLPERVLDAESRESDVRVRSHDTNDAASLSVETGGDDTKNDVLRGEDSSDTLTVVLHHAHRGRPLLPHETSSVPHARLDTDRGSGRASVEDGSEVGEGHLVAKGLDVGEERVGVVGATKLLLGAFEGGVELLGGSVRLFELLERLVEDFGDVEETDDVAFFVADGL
jgi:hypothetical protein